MTDRSYTKLFQEENNATIYASISEICMFCSVISVIKGGDLRKAKNPTLIMMYTTLPDVL